MGQDVAIVVVVGIAVVGRFLWRELRERRFVIARIFLLPAVLGAIGVGLGVWAVVVHPETAGIVVGGVAVALAVGAAIGYGVARFTTVRVTEDPKVLYARGSYTTVAIWVVAVALRFIVRAPFLASPSRHSHVTAALNAAALILLASALFFVRYRLVAAGRAERVRGTSLAAAAI